MSFNRREFIRLSSLTSAYTVLAPRFAFAVGDSKTSTAARAPVTVVVFMRGAMDGISYLPPIDDPTYFSIRPNIAITSAGSNTPSPKNGTILANANGIKLKDGFGLHPSLSEIRKLFENGEASFFFEAGSPFATRSHFDAQDWMESGLPQGNSENTGFLGRVSAKFPPQSATAGFSTVAVQNGLPRILKGAPNGLAFADFKSLKLKGPLTRDGLDGKKDENLDPAISKLYGQSQDPLFHRAAQSFLQGSTVLQKAEHLFEDEKKELPKGPLAKDLAQISALIRSDVGVKLAVTEMGGWDTHVNQGNGEKGSLKDRLTEFDSAIGAFWKSLGDRRDQVCLIAITEFGRTAAENGDRGTDHGHGSTFTVINGHLRPQKIFHQFKSLAKSDLNEGRDLNVHFDYRQIFAEVLAQHSKITTPLTDIFPGFSPPANPLGIFRT